MAYVSREITASGTEASVVFSSQIKEIQVLKNDSANYIEFAFGESVVTADEVIKLLANEEFDNIVIGGGSAAKTLYYKASGAGSNFRIVATLD